ncbi:MAG: hypothetical protein CHACPFDD_00957 [Phycisphaerae bacterium]|nr:hypothetical protein [Phycisphaerae bacterium]
MNEHEPAPDSKPVDSSAARGTSPRRADLFRSDSSPHAGVDAVVIARPLTWAVPPRAALDLSALSPRDARLDFWLVLLVAVILPYGGAALLSIQAIGEEIEMPSISISVGAKLIELSLALVLLSYLLLRHRTAPRCFGIRANQLGQQLAWGVAGFVACYVYLFLSALLIIPIYQFFAEDVNQRVELMRALPTGDALRGAILMGAVATHEEIIFRGLLLPYARRITGSWSCAVAIVALVFGALHLLQGVIGAVQVTGLGIVLSLIFIASRSLPAVIIAHFGFNFVQLLLAPLLLKLAETQ